MTDRNNFRLSLLVGLLCAISSVQAVGSDKTDLDNPVLRFAKSDFERKMNTLSQAIRRCDKVELSSVRKLDLAKSGLSKDELARMVQFVSERNFRRCEGHTRAEASYALHTYSKVLDHYGINRPHLNASNLSQVNRTLFEPDIRYVQRAAEFRSLPEQTKDYLEKSLGNKPFDPVKTYQRSIAR